MYSMCFICCNAALMSWLIDIASHLPSMGRSLWEDSLMGLSQDLSVRLFVGRTLSYWWPYPRHSPALGLFHGSHRQILASRSTPVSHCLFSCRSLHDKTGYLFSCRIGIDMRTQTFKGPLLFIYGGLFHFSYTPSYLDP